MPCERTENRFAVLEEVVIHSYCAAHHTRGLEARVAYLEKNRSKAPQGVTGEPDRDSDRRVREMMSVDIQETRAEVRRMTDELEKLKVDLIHVGVQVEDLMRDLGARNPA